jgi:hypothetical protein
VPRIRRTNEAPEDVGARTQPLEKAREESLVDRAALRAPGRPYPHAESAPRGGVELDPTRLELREGRPVDRVERESFDVERVTERVLAPSSSRHRRSTRKGARRNYGAAVMLTLPSFVSMERSPTPPATRSTFVSRGPHGASSQLF